MIAIKYTICRALIFIYIWQNQYSTIYYNIVQYIILYYLIERINFINIYTVVIWIINTIFTFELWHSIFVNCDIYSRCLFRISHSAIYFNKMTYLQITVTFLCNAAAHRQCLIYRRPGRTATAIVNWSCSTVYFGGKNLKKKKVIKKKMYKLEFYIDCLIIELCI